MSQNVTAQNIQGVNAVVLVRPITAQPTDPWINSKNSKYKISPKAEVKKSANTTDGIIRNGGLHDYELTFEGDLDVSSLPASAIETNIMPGMILDFQAYRSNTLYPTGQFWAGRIIIEEAEFGGGTDENIAWSFKASKQSGTLSCPNGTTQF